MRIRTTRSQAKVAAALAAAGALVAAGGATAGASTSSFTTGDLVVYQVASNTSTSGAVSLVDYSTTGTPSGYSVTLPTTNTTGSYELTESGTATNDGQLEPSADGRSLVATGYTAPTGVASITKATGTPRTVAIVSASGTVDTSTSLTDTTTEAQNFRSAVISASGASPTIYTGGGSGVGVVADGGSSASYVSTDNVHALSIVGGNLYDSTTTGINQVGTGLPTAGSTTTDTVLLGTANTPAKFAPDQFALVTLGGGTTPNTLYVADNANNAIEKYSLVSGAWTAEGSVAATGVVGLVASVSGGTATIYATDANPAGVTGGYVDQLVSLADTSGAGGTLASSTVPTVLATAPTGTGWHGLAFAPSASPAPSTPEVPWAALLPLLGAGLVGGAVVLRRRRSATA